jgi:hypothetical protein
MSSSIDKINQDSKISYFYSSMSDKYGGGSIPQPNIVRCKDCSERVIKKPEEPLEGFQEREQDR